MATSKLALYNLALGHLNERKIGSLSENREPRRVLDDFWDQVVAECIAEGFWNFAIRAVEMTNAPSISPSFGYNYGFTHPDDWVRTVQISDEETFRFPLFDYRDENGYWFANSTPLYARYISNGASYGLDLSKWPANFTAWVAFKLAEYACGRVAGKADLLQGPQGIIKRGGRAKLKAKSTDAMDEAPARPPMGTWGRSRVGSGRLSQPGGDRYDD